MNKLLLILALFISNFIAAQNNKIGYIFSVKVDISQYLRNPIRNINFIGVNRDPRGNAAYPRGNTVNFKRNGGIFEIYDVNCIIEEIASKIKSISTMDSIVYESAQESNKAQYRLSRIGKSILFDIILKEEAPYYTVEFFPSVGINKAIKSKHQEYYDVKIKVKFGGYASDLMIMNKVKKKAFFKYAVDVKITAIDNDKKELWKKKETFKDFSQIVAGSIGKKYYKVESTFRTPSTSTIVDSIFIAINHLFVQ